MPTLVRIEHCYVRFEPVRRHSTSLAFRLGRGFLSYFDGVATAKLFTECYKRAVVMPSRVLASGVPIGGTRVEVAT
jgi:hypothetical protein